MAPMHFDARTEPNTGHNRLMTYNWQLMLNVGPNISCAANNCEASAVGLERLSRRDPSSSLLAKGYFAGGGGGRLPIMFMARASMEPTSATLAGSTSVLLVLASSPNLPMYCSATRNCTAS
jgi:hypothetical protein